MFMYLPHEVNALINHSIYAQYPKMFNFNFLIVEKIAHNYSSGYFKTAKIRSGKYRLPNPKILVIIIVQGG